MYKYSCEGTQGRVHKGRLALNKDTNKLVVVTGAGGFIGGSLVAQLRARGYKRIRAVDMNPLNEWYQKFDDVENLILDLNEKQSCEVTARGATDIYNLAANMGGMGFIETTRRCVCFRC